MAASPEPQIHLTIEETDARGLVARITIDHPSHLNILNASLILALTSAVNSLRAHDRRRSHASWWPNFSSVTVPPLRRGSGTSTPRCGVCHAEGVVGAYDIGGHALPPPCTNGLHLVQERLYASAVLPLSMPMPVAQGERMGGHAHWDAIIACVCLESPTWTSIPTLPHYRAESQVWQGCQASEHCEWQFAAFSTRELDISETVALRHMLKIQVFVEQDFW